MKLRILYFLAIFLILEGCRQKTDPKLVSEPDTVESDSKTKFVIDATADAEYMVDSYSNGLFAIQLAELVKYKTENANVKTVAVKISDTQKKIVSEIGDMANKKKISLPSNLNLQQRSKLKELSEQHSQVLEKEFLNQIENSHKKEMGIFEKLSTESEDNEISTLAIYCLSAVQSQYEEVIALKDRMEF